MRKKLLSVLLSLVLVLSLAPTVAHAMSFPDVPEDSDYMTAVEYISDLRSCTNRGKSSIMRE